MKKAGLPVRSDGRFLREIRAHIDRYRLAGYDVERGSDTGSESGGELASTRTHDSGFSG